MARINYFRGLTALAAMTATAMVAVLMAYTPASAQIAPAPTFVVNSTGDGADTDPTDEDCLAGFMDDGSGGLTAECTLRAAIQQANATPGADAISFNISDDLFGAGVKSIKPNSNLPDITGQVTIDGYTQPGASPNTNAALGGGTNTNLLIELDGTNVVPSRPGGPEIGLFIISENSVVRGLAINRFYFGIDVFGTGNKLEGNFIGTDAAGTSAPGNDGDGVIIFGSNNIIGGTTPDKRNLISANKLNGVWIAGSLLNGGVLPAGNRIEGNLIGTDASGTLDDLGNALDGVLITEASNNFVGGTAAGAGNAIAFNASNGVNVIKPPNLAQAAVPTKDRILGNSIFSNRFLGIALDDDGRTLNDPGDTDEGANTLQNFPVITSAKPSRRMKTTIKGTLNSTPNQTFTVQIFSNPSGEDEGKTFIGQRNVKTDRKGNAPFALKVARTVAPVGASITSTATRLEPDPADPASLIPTDTSEFSDAVPVSS